MSISKSYFRTIESATLPCPSGALKFVTVKSPALAGRADISIYIPAQAAGRSDLPVVTLLHGVYGSHWAWAFSGKAHLTLQRLIDAGKVPPMILAMPSDGLWGDGSGYLKHHGQDFESWIVKDVPQAVSGITGNALEAQHFIGGLSMGGFGALRIGARHPDRFQAISAHSSVTRLQDMAQYVEEPLASYAAELEAPELNVLESILQNRDKVGAIRFDCGIEDVLIEGNRRLAEELRAAGFAHTYAEYPGAHTWEYWEAQVSRSFKFFAECC